MLQMIVAPSPAPQPIEWNYAELKEELSASLEQYRTRVYTEADIPQAKKEKAKLNQLKTVLNDERIRREREYMQPFSEFKAQVKELCDLIDEASGNIGEQLDAFEAKRIEEKRAEIEALYPLCVTEVFAFKAVPDWLALDRILDNKWLNKTFTMSKVKEAIMDRLLYIYADLETLDHMHDGVGTEYYKKTLDLNLALKQSQEVREVQACTEEVKPAPKEEQTVVVAFEATLTPTQAKALGDFCRKNGIKLKQIKKEI